MHLRWIKRKIEYHVFLFYSVHLFHFDTGPTYITASFSDQAFPLHTLTTKPRSCDKPVASLHSFGLAQVTVMLRSTDDNYLPFLYGLSQEHLYIYSQTFWLQTLFGVGRGQKQSDGCKRICENILQEKLISRFLTSVDYKLNVHGDKNQLL